MFGISLHIHLRTAANEIKKEAIPTSNHKKRWFSLLAEQKLAPSLVFGLGAELLLRLLARVASLRISFGRAGGMIFPDRLQPNEVGGWGRWWNKAGSSGGGSHLTYNAFFLGLVCGSKIWE
jgi:hypothetical protein